MNETKPFRTINEKDFQEFDISNSKKLYVHICDIVKYHAFLFLSILFIATIFLTIIKFIFITYDNMLLYDNSLLSKIKIYYWIIILYIIILFVYVSSPITPKLLYDSFHERLITLFCSNFKYGVNEIFIRSLIFFCSIYLIINLFSMLSIYNFTDIFAIPNLQNSSDSIQLNLDDTQIDLDDLSSNLSLKYFSFGTSMAYAGDLEEILKDFNNETNKQIFEQKISAIHLKHLQKPVSNRISHEDIATILTFVFFNLIAAYLLMYIILQFIMSLGAWPKIGVKNKLELINYSSNQNCNSFCTIAHWSDLHITDKEDSLRTDLMGNGGNKSLKEIITKYLNELYNVDTIFITGDVTDSGMAIEWRNFFNIINNNNKNLIDKIIVVPGNHDINIPHKYNHYLVENEKQHGRNLRLIRAMAAIDTIQGNRSYILTDSNKVVTLRHYLLSFKEALNHFAEELVVESNSPTPKQIWNNMFPMIVTIQNKDISAIVLDSNSNSSSIATNAFGKINQNTINKLIKLLSLYKGRPFVILLHHHIAFPHFGTYNIMTKLKERFTVFDNARTLLSELKKFDPTIIFHGHHHVGYFGTCDKFQIVAARSTTLGEPFVSQKPGFSIIYTSKISNRLQITNEVFYSL